MPPGRPGPPRGQAAMTVPLIAPLIPPRARPGGGERGRPATARRRRVSALRATSQERSRQACSNSSPPAQSQLVADSFMAWAPEQQRQPGDLPLRVILLATTAPVTDASGRGGSDFDFALPLRDRAGAA